MRWVDGVMQDLGSLPSAWPGYVGATKAYGISGNGEVVVGEADTGDINRGYRGFRWAEDTGMITVEEWLRGQDVAVASDVTRIARATNCDGSVIVGELWDGQMFIARGAGRGDCTSAGIEPDDDPEDAAGIRAEL